LKPYPRANISESEGVTLSVDLYNRIVEDIERLDRIAVMPPLFMTGGASGTTIGIQQNPAELVLVAIIGTETGGGRYQGSILYGNSTGNTSNNFQLQSTAGQSATDGPAPITQGSGAYVNNALVINLSEQYVNGTHVLYAPTAEFFYAIGRVTGYTADNPPRAIVYIDNWPYHPVIAKITGTFTSTLGGIYYGRLTQGPFANDSNFGYSFLLSSLSSGYIASNDNCWITNNWEQTYSSPPHNGLSVGQYVWGITAGFPQFSVVTSGNSSINNVWYQVYTWFPIQSAVLTHPIQNLVTVQTANSTYSLNEQSMLNNLKTDVSNIQASLSNLYANLKVAGYSL
jgi:hypothetical protein